MDGGHRARRPGAATIDAGTSKRLLAAIARGLDADCIVSGHTHRPLVREEAGCLFVNPGSVGEALATATAARAGPGSRRARAGCTRTSSRCAEPLATVRARD